MQRRRKARKTIMKSERLLLWTLALVQFTHIVDFMIIMPLGSQFMKIFDINPRAFSLMVSVYALFAFIANLFSAAYIDRFDRRKALLWLYVGFTLATVACALAPNYWVFLIFRGMTGAFGGTLGAVILAIVGDVIPLERRGRAVGWVMMAFSAASIAGVPAGIFLAASFGWRAPFLTIGLVSLIILGLAWYVIPSIQAHVRAVEGRPSPLKLLTDIFRDANQRMALLFTLTLMLGHFTIIPFIAPYMQLNIGFSNHQVGYIYTLGGLLTVGLLPLFGRLSDRLGHAKVFTFMSFFALFSIFAITNLPPTSIGVALLATSSFFIVASGRNVPATTMSTAVVKPENRGSFMSMRQSVNEMALAGSSFLAGMIIVERPDGSLGNYHYVGYLAILMSMLAMVLAWRLRAEH